MMAIAMHRRHADHDLGGEIDSATPAMSRDIRENAATVQRVGCTGTARQELSHGLGAACHRPHASSSCRMLVAFASGNDSPGRKRLKIIRYMFICMQMHTLAQLSEARKQASSTRDFARISRPACLQGLA